MLIYFRTKKLQKICNSKAYSTRMYGPKMAGKLQQRLMEMKAAPAWTIYCVNRHHDAISCQEIVRGNCQ
jgi:hypothetical protein